MKRLAVLLLLALAAPAWGQKLTLPAEKTAEAGQLIVVKADTDCPALVWLVLDPGLSQIPPELLKDTTTAVLLAAKDGTYRILAIGAKADKPVLSGECKITIGKPVPPPPPDPPKPPDPPTPPTGDVRVLLVYDKQVPLSTGQQNALFSSEVADYLSRVCIREGAVSSWRVWDLHPEITDKEPQAIREMWDAIKGMVSNPPYVVVAVGKQIKLLPLPASSADLVALLKKETGK